MWGDKGDGLGRVDSLYTGFYGGKSKGGLMKACVVGYLVSFMIPVCDARLFNLLFLVPA